MALGVRTAVSGSFTTCGSVGAAVVAFGVGAAVSRSFSTGARGGDVVVIDCHADSLSSTVNTAVLPQRGGIKPPATGSSIAAMKMCRPQHLGSAPDHTLPRHYVVRD
jgi:hypothetical protein